MITAHGSKDGSSDSGSNESGDSKRSMRPSTSDGETVCGYQPKQERRGGVSGHDGQPDIPGIYPGYIRESPEPTPLSCAKE